MRKAWISGTGSYLPERVVTNEEVCRTAKDTSDEWIRAKLGIVERRVAAPDEQASDLAAHALKRAIAGAGLQPNDLSGIICSVGVGDVPVPATACYIQHKVGITNHGFAFDVKMACAGAMGGIMLARSLVESGAAKNVGVVGTQLISRTILDPRDRGTAPIFGDGAGAVVVSAAESEQSAIVSSRLHTDGSLTEIVGQYVGGTREWFTPEAVAAGRVRLEMDGRAVWECAERTLPKVIHEVLEDARMRADELDFVVAHQANKRLLMHILELARIPPTKTYTNIERYGNTSAASALIALDEVSRQGIIHRGDKVLMIGIGAGMVWGAHILRW